MSKVDGYMNDEYSEMGGRAAHDANTMAVVDDGSLVVIIGGGSVGDSGNSYGCGWQ